MSEVVCHIRESVESMVRQLLEKTAAMDRLRPDDRVMIKQISWYPVRSGVRGSIRIPSGGQPL